MFRIKFLNKIYFASHAVFTLQSGESLCFSAKMLHLFRGSFKLFARLVCQCCHEVVICCASFVLY